MRRSASRASVGGKFGIIGTKVILSAKPRRIELIAVHVLLIMTFREAIVSESGVKTQPNAIDQNIETLIGHTALQTMYYTLIGGDLMQELTVATRNDRVSNGRKPREMPNTGERLVTSVVNETTVEHLHRYGLAIDLCGNKVVLDIASGEGYGSSLLARKASRVYGVDISSDAVEHAKKKYKAPNLKFLHGRADAIPVADQKIEVAVSFETLEHHDLHDEMMRELRRVLKNHGLLIISTPEKRYYSEEPKVKNEFHVKELYENEFRDLLSRHFRNIRVVHQRILYTSVIDAEEGDSGIILFKGGYGGISKIHRIEKAPYLVALASDGALPPLRTSLFDGTEVQLKRERDLRRREVQVVYKEAELQKLHNLIPLTLYQLIRDPIKKLLRLQTQPTTP
jgi:ubiquinone/menaquinone biosynthesis C-methylase UbiE